jgi:hypothetical protein
LDETIAEFAVPADKRMFKSMFSANVPGNDRKSVIGAIIAIAIVVLILWLVVGPLHP